MVDPSAYPRSLPRAREVPTPSGVQTVYVDDQPRCAGSYRGADGHLRHCHKLLAEFVARPWSITCRCGTKNVRNAPSPVTMQSAA